MTICHRLTKIGATSLARFNRIQPNLVSSLPARLYTTKTTTPIKRNLRALYPPSFHPTRRNMATAQDVPARDFGSFKLLQSFPIKYAPVTVSKWRSEKTGLTVVVGSHEAPVVRLRWTSAVYSSYPDQWTLCYRFRE